MDGPEPWDAAACAAFAAGLGDRVLARAVVLFALLEADGEVECAELALALGLPRPQLVPGAVNTRLKVRARELGLPLPFDGGCSHATRGPTVWHDRAGLAGRVLAALRAEGRLRAGSPAAGRGRGRP